jgi:uncharacterized protein (DUF433 family)
MMTDVAVIVDLLERPVYGLSQVDYILGLTPGTARRWIDGYRRGERSYDPVVRLRTTGSDTVTWGEFVETRLLSEYRDAGVPLIRMRPAIDRLRDELDSKYPLASAKAWLAADGRELVRRVQEEVGLDRNLSLVVVRSGQAILDWSRQADDFRASAEWTGTDEDAQIRLLRPNSEIREVVVDPLRSFGEPSVRGVRTDIIAELVRAGDPPDMIADLYELPRASVDAAVRYELLRVRPVS